MNPKVLDYRYEEHDRKQYFYYKDKEMNVESGFLPKHSALREADLSRDIKPRVAAVATMIRACVCEEDDVDETHYLIYAWLFALDESYAYMTISSYHLDYLLYRLYYAFKTMNSGRLIKLFMIDQFVKKVFSRIIPRERTHRISEECKSDLEFFKRDIKTFSEMVENEEDSLYELTYRLTGRDDTITGNDFDELFILTNPLECAPVIIINRDGEIRTKVFTNYAHKITNMPLEEKNSIIIVTEYGVVIIPFNEMKLKFRGRELNIANVTQTLMHITQDRIEIVKCRAIESSGVICVRSTFPMVYKMLIHFISIRHVGRYWYYTSKDATRTTPIFNLYFEPSQLCMNLDDESLSTQNAKVSITIQFNERSNDTSSYWRCMYTSKYPKYVPLCKGMLAMFVTKFSNMMFDHEFGVAFNYYYRLMLNVLDKDDELVKRRTLGNTDRRVTMKHFSEASSVKSAGIIDKQFSRKAQGIYRPIIISERERAAWEYFITKECKSNVKKIAAANEAGLGLTPIKEFEGALYVEYNPTTHVGVHIEGDRKSVV